MNRRAFRHFLWLLIFLWPGIYHCAGTRPVLEPAEVQARYQRMRQRVAVREDSTHTASYRVRWRVREVEPHSEMILRIDYRAPASYHVVGKGPMDVPVFTAWVIDSQYVLLAHREQQRERGHLRDLRPEDFTMDIRPLGGFLGLFSGGTGLQLPVRFAPAAAEFDYQDVEHCSWTDEQGRTVEMDLARSRLTGIRWSRQSDREHWDLIVRFDDFSDHYPFWELASAAWENLDGPGKYLWDVLACRHNPNLPARLFIPPED